MNENPVGERGVSVILIVPLGNEHQDESGNFVKLRYEICATAPKTDLGRRNALSSYYPWEVDADVVVVVDVEVDVDVEADGATKG